MALVEFVAYYRVSTQQQKRSGLGLLAQKETVKRYIEQAGGLLRAEFSEIESGRNNTRPQLHEALRICRVYSSTLVIARLDRLARNVSLTSALMNSRIEFVAADMPLANRFTLQILAAVAEYESVLISQRTKAAIAVAKAQGRKFGCPDPSVLSFAPHANKARMRARREKSKNLALDFLPLLCELRDRGETIHGIALQLSAMRIETPKKGKAWSDLTVARMFEYAGERKPKPWASRRSAAERRSRHQDLPVLCGPSEDAH